MTFRQEPNRIFDFMSLTPESMHMLTWLFSPRGIPANYRHMQGFGVNTYKLVNAAGRGGAGEVPLGAAAGRRSRSTQEQADAIQATELGHASQDLYEAIERGDFPEWELRVQIMERRRAPRARLRPARRHQDLARGPLPAAPGRADGARPQRRNYFAENEQVAFGTGVLVDGLDFCDDKMLVGRTFSYSDTQRYRVGPNYLQLPINAAAHAAGHQPARRPDGLLRGPATGENPHVNYEPTSTGGLSEAEAAGTGRTRPDVRRPARRAEASSARNDYEQAGERYRTMPDWERDDLVTTW